MKLDLSELEDPAPKRGDTNHLAHSVPSAAPVPSGQEAVSKRSKKRKLPFRAELTVDATRYKGIRISRTDADLDVSTIGLLPDDDAPAVRPNSASSLHVQEGKLDQGESYLDIRTDDDDDGGSEFSTDVEQEKQDSLLEDHPQRKRKAFSAAEQLEVEERAVAARLANTEKKERTRAVAVKRQKEVYDTVVDLRIRMEPIISLARQFPSSKQRQSCAAWTANEDVAGFSEKIDNVLSSLCAHVENAWQASWAGSVGGGEVSHTGFEKWRDSILDEWGRKVSEASGVVPKGGFKTFDTSISAQMKASLATGKHLQRTRRIKESIKLVGLDLELEQGLSDVHYDDGELYRTLLREIIESGEGEGGGLRYAQLSKSGKVKKMVDRSFAKGRRIKYDVHEKIVGFLAPVPLPDPGPLDEIIAAIFGKRGTVQSRVE